MGNIQNPDRIKATEQLAILDLKPGHWREVATTINLGEGVTSKLLPDKDGMIYAGNPTLTKGDVVIEEGSQININRQYRYGEISIKVTPKPTPGVEITPYNQSYHVTVPESNLEEKFIDVVIEE
ncbi:MAG: hypothetical protein WC806_05635 [Candidatus Gracilibacteria bacterium]|jgi:hypothetical protein